MTCSQHWLRAGAILGAAGLAGLSARTAGSRPVPPAHAATVTVAGSGSGKAEEPKIPVPKISGVSPAIVLLDGSSTSVTIDLSGSDLPERDADLQVSFDSDPAEHLQILGSAAVLRVSSSLMRVTISVPAGTSLENLLPADAPQKFRVIGNVLVGKEKKLVSSEPSSATVTARRPLFAEAIWVIDPPVHGDRQVRLQVPNVSDDVRVNIIDSKSAKVPCSTPKVFAGDEVVCYLPRALKLTGGLYVQVLRANEHEAPQAWNESKLGSDIGDPPAASDCAGSAGSGSACIAHEESSPLEHKAP